MQPQDILYGLDLLNPEHRELMKEVIRKQKPDVISLAPPCGPWSAWQRLRKNSFALRADETTASTSLGVRGLGLGVSELTWWSGAFGAASFK